ncbi:YveK family protein [Mycolicibacterium smegmatis]|uniref:YveK family protein n=1 Tax=Mycolicibacterium smegmatis TaxID=1772 RepID=UPI001EFBED16|nr:protein tyrosine kinase [Mycolicibacterium smegmatis]ULN34672.1 protein tyrosine kinase [Mycolicibacterium smegmatis]
MNLKSFVDAAQRFWSTYLLVAGMVLIIGAAAILMLPVTYVSSARLMVSIEGSTTAAAYQNEEVAIRRIRTYIPLLTTDAVTRRVIDKLGLPMTPPQLAAELSATNVPPKTSLIDIRVTDASPDRAELIANTVAREFVAYTAAIETATGEDSQKIHTTLVSDATPARRDPVERALLYLLAALAALLLGAAAVWIRATREQLEPDANAAIGSAPEPVESAEGN